MEAINRKRPPLFTEKHRERLSEAKIGNKNSVGRIPWNKNRKDLPKQTEEHIEKRVSQMRGDKHHMWKNGISSIQKLEYKEKIAGRPKPKQCEICDMSEKDIKKSLCFDHNHKTGEFRGWICHRCNLVLGHIKDDPILLIKLIKYLKK